MGNVDEDVAGLDVDFNPSGGRKDISSRDGVVPGDGNVGVDVVKGRDGLACYLVVLEAGQTATQHSATGQIVGGALAQRRQQLGLLVGLNAGLVDIR